MTDQLTILDENVNALDQDPRVNRGRVNPGAEDLLRAMGLVAAIGGDDSDVRCLRMDGAPWSKSRPRHTRTGVTYTKPEDRAAEKRTASVLRDWCPEAMPGSVALVAIFYRPNRQRIDADNMLKHICDAANGICWYDDSQVTAVLGIIELDADHPRTVLAMAPHYTTMTRGADWVNFCARCTREFVVDPKNVKRKYCSNDCAVLARGHVLGPPVPCQECGELYKRATTAQKYCSPACRAAAVKGRPKSKGRPPPHQPGELPQPGGRPMSPPPASSAPSVAPHPAAPTTCDWAACRRKASRFLDGWWHCGHHALEHLAEQLTEQSRDRVVSLAEVRAAEQKAIRQRREQAFTEAQQMLDVGYRGYTADDLRGRDKTRHITEARQDLMLLIWLQTRVSTVQLGRLFGRDHTTVLHALRRARERLGVAS